MMKFILRVFVVVVDETSSIGSTLTIANKIQIQKIKFQKEKRKL